MIKFARNSNIDLHQDFTIQIHESKIVSNSNCRYRNGYTSNVYAKEIEQHFLLPEHSVGIRKLSAISHAEG